MKDNVSSTFKDLANIVSGVGLHNDDIGGGVVGDTSTQMPSLKVLILKALISCRFSDRCARQLKQLREVCYISKHCGNPRQN